MNLVAKEYVACQIQEPGVLILSPFTGAGETMHEAIIANPLEEHSLAKAIHHALTMPLVQSHISLIDKRCFCIWDYALNHRSWNHRILELRNNK